MAFDEKTEVLTREGWKVWPRVGIHDQLLTLRDDQSIHLESPRRIQISAHHPYFISIQNDQTDLLVTHAHKVVVDHLGYPALRVSHHILAEEVKPWSGGVWSAYQEGEPNWYKLLGFFLSHHSLLTRSCVIIPQPNGAAVLNKLLDQLELSYEIRLGDYYISLPREKVGIFSTHYGYFIPRLVGEYLFGLQRAELMALKESLLSGCAEGVPHADRMETQGWYDGLQALWALTGQNLTTPHLRHNPTINLPLNCQLVHQPGPVYSCEVISGMIYVRRNGKPTWCGN